jgi:hypothetical protein
MEHYAGIVPESLDNLSPEERHQIYKMLRIEVLAYPDKSLEVSGSLVGGGEAGEMGLCVAPPGTGLGAFGLTQRYSSADGHTASLFSETSAIEVHDRWVVANPVAGLDTTRITLTIPVINATRAVIFLVAGEDKAEALREILEGDADPREYPATLIQPSGGPKWMLDQSAASLLGDHL